MTTATEAIAEGAAMLESVKKKPEPSRDGVLSTRDVRKRVNILIDRMKLSGTELIKRQHGYPEPNPEKIAFHTGRIAAAQTFERLLSATPEQWDAEMEKLDAE